jgi:type IV secretion system protein VirD4
MLKFIKEVGGKISDWQADERRKRHARILSELRTYADVMDEADFSLWPKNLGDCSQEQLDDIIELSGAEHNLAVAKERRARIVRRTEIDEWFETVLDNTAAMLTADSSKCLSKGDFRSFYNHIYQSNTGVWNRGGVAGEWAAFDPPKVSRPIADLSPKEISALRASALLYVHSGKRKPFELDKLTVAWSSGRGHHGRGSSNGWISTEGLNKLLPDLNSVVSMRLGEVKTVLKGDPETDLFQDLAPAFNEGQSWANQICAPFVAHIPGGTLEVGRLNREPIGFGGNESLLTIGGPGSGKTQGQVIPNVLHYRGPVIVLDVKGEVFDATAGHRQSSGSTVYRFSLIKDDGPNHQYNPLDAISRDEDEVFDDAHRMAEVLIQRAADEKDPFWVNSARDLVAALIASVVIDPEVEVANFTALLDRLMSAGKRRIEVLEHVQAIGKAAGIRQLAYAGETLVSLAEENERTFESIVQQARQALTPFGSPIVERATRGSDWAPSALRAPGASLYLAVPQDKIEFFAPLLRLILSQHLDALMKAKAESHEELPLTIFLDELPQLGNFEPIVKAIELGRGYGIRVWGFAQNAQQIERSFERAAVILDSVAVRAFLSIDQDAAERLSRALGETENMITGERRPLASPAELLGPNFKDCALILGRNSAPIKAVLVPAWKGDSEALIKPYVDTVAAS